MFPHLSHRRKPHLRFRPHLKQTADHDQDRTLAQRQASFLLSYRSGFIPKIFTGLPKCKMKRNYTHGFMSSSKLEATLEFFLSPKINSQPRSTAAEVKRRLWWWRRGLDPNTSRAGRSICHNLLDYDRRIVQNSSSTSPPPSACKKPSTSSGIDPSLTSN